MAIVCAVNGTERAFFGARSVSGRTGDYCPVPVRFTSSGLKVLA